MVDALLTVWRLIYVQTFELAGAAAVVVGVHQLAGPGATWAATGVALLGKSLELDMNRKAAKR